MKRFLAVMSFALLAFITAAQAQITTVTTAWIWTRNIERLEGNVIGNPVSTINYMFNPDTVLFDLNIKADSLSVTSSRVRIDLIWEGKQVSRVTSTLNPTHVFIWPENDAQVTGLGIPDSLFTIVWNSPLQPNEQFRVLTRLVNPVEYAAKYGRTVPDTLTIAVHDTINQISDTSYSDAFPGHVAYYGLFYTVAKVNANDVPMWGVGYQLKINGAGGWFSPLGVLPNRLYMIQDSVTVPSAPESPPDSLKFIGFSPTTAADSIRVANIGKSSLDSSVIRSIQLIKRD